MNSNRRPPLALLSLTAAICGLFLSPAEAAQSDEDLRASVKKFTQLYQAVETNFADKVDADRLVYRGAIPGMLRTLDPHSNFFDAKAWQILREGQAGHYYGVGMLVGQPEGHVLVLYPFQGSPAYRAGLRPGDRIIAVDDKDATKLNVSDVSALLKGPRGTKVRIVVRREGNVEPLIFGVVRDEVPRGSVRQRVMKWIWPWRNSESSRLRAWCWTCATIPVAW
jgi:carboxyl-terminal processing protease